MPTASPAPAPPPPDAASPLPGVEARPAPLLVANVAFTLVGGVTAAVLLGALGASLDEVSRFATSSAVATSLVALLGWPFVTRARRASRLKGAAVGLLVGLASHPPTWWVFALLDEAPLAELWLDGLYLSTYSLPLYGWLTGPLAALLGAALGRPRTRTRAAHAPTRRP